MKARSTRAAGQHLARERGAYEDAETYSNVRGPDSKPLFCRLNQASREALEATVKRFGLEVKAE